MGSGILMGNAPEELKKRIPTQTKDNEHDGIYAALVKMGWIEADGKEKTAAGLSAGRICLLAQDKLFF